MTYLTRLTLHIVTEQYFYENCPDYSVLKYMMTDMYIVHTGVKIVGKKKE